MEPLTDSDIEALAMERSLTEETEAQHAKRIFREHLVPAALSIAHLAVFGTNDKLRLDAAKYVVERNLGRIQDDPPKQDDDPYEALIRECTSWVETAGEEAA